MSSNSSYGAIAPISGVASRENNPFTQANSQVMSDLAWELKLLTTITHEQVLIAKREGVNIQKQVDKIVKTILNAPSFQDAHQSRELIYVQQLTLRGYYCSQIMRKITKHRICRMAELARQNPNLSSQIGLINQCEKWLLKHLPEKDMYVIKHPAAMAESCKALEYKMEEMQEKIFLKAKVPRIAETTQTIFKNSESSDFRK